MERSGDFRRAFFAGFSGCFHGKMSPLAEGIRYEIPFLPSRNMLYLAEEAFVFQAGGCGKRGRL